MSLFTGGIAIAAALSAAGGTVAASKIASNSANKGTKAQLASNREALTSTQTKAALDRKDALAAQRANYQQYVAREQRYAPYRASGEAANQTIAHLLGLPNVTVAPPPAMPDYLKEQNTMAALLPKAQGR